MTDIILSGFAIICRELMYFSCVGFLIFAIDELAIDLIWIGSTLWRKMFVYNKHRRTTATTMPASLSPGKLAIFVPAWDESTVIAKMLHYAVTHLRHNDYTIFVGCYPNDPDTIKAVTSVKHDAIRLVVCDSPGPTSKADCLNNLWRQLERTPLGEDFKAVILHDAEDLISPDELAIFDRLIDDNALVQLPVVPLIDYTSRWVAGHYCDEFAEAHGKTLPVRERLGAGVPSAGVGCALRVDVLAEMSSEASGPFNVDSLTEDYELGLRIHELGFRTIFVSVPDNGTYGVVGTRAHFPNTLEAAIRQKTRWTIGIAIAGWDRVGWGYGAVEFWMRLRDRRTVMAAILITAAYLSLMLACLLLLADAIGWAAPIETSPAFALLLRINAAFLIWRLVVRGYFVTRLYGWREGLLSVPRSVVANAITIVSARRAVWQYLGAKTGKRLIWDKTDHIFPADPNVL